MSSSIENNGGRPSSEPIFSSSRTKGIASDVAEAGRVLFGWIGGSALGLGWVGSVRSFDMDGWS